MVHLEVIVVPAGDSASSIRFRKSRILRVALVVAALICVSGAIVLNAQNPAPDEVRMSSHAFVPGGITVKTSLVEVDTVVRDDAGRSVAGLKAEDFAITDNGKPQKVSGFTVQTLVHASADSAAGAQQVAAPETSSRAAPSQLPQRQIRRDS